jgi:hypothetical protein
LREWKTLDGVLRKSDPRFFGVAMAVALRGIQPSQTTPMTTTAHIHQLPAHSSFAVAYTPKASGAVASGRLLPEYSFMCRRLGTPEPMWKLPVLARYMARYTTIRHQNMEVPHDHPTCTGQVGPLKRYSEKVEQYGKQRSKMDSHRLRAPSPIRHET